MLWLLPYSWITVLSAANLVFVVIFAAESFFKIMGFGFLAYLFDDWNKFDFVVAALSIAGLFVNAGVGANVSDLPLLFWLLHCESQNDRN